MHVNSTLGDCGTKPLFSRVFFFFGMYK